MRIDRLILTAVVAAGLIAGSAFQAEAAPRKHRNRTEQRAEQAPKAPKYIFYFIGDGMGPGPVMATENYIRMVQNNANPLVMSSMPVSSRARTFSASSPVTDSAAAGTALSTGSKTKNGMLGMNADTVNVTSMARILKDDGYGVGLVTSCAADDATPAAFYAHVPKRSMYYEVGKDAASSGYDFIAGAGLRGAKDKKGNATDLYDVLEQNNVTVMRGAEGAKAVYTSSAEKIMLLNPLDYGNLNEFGYAIDSTGSDGVGLTLAVATEACLHHLLKNSPDRFFMMVEGGLIDHALHGNDGATAIKEVIDFDNTIRIAYEFYEQHPDETLIVVTADHDTGGMSNGNAYTGYNAYPALVDSQRLSKGEFSDYCKSILKSRRVYTWDDMREYLEDALGFWKTVKLSEDQTEDLREMFTKTFVDRDAPDEKGLYNSSNAFAAEVYRVYNNCSGWGFTTSNHTGNYVPVFAAGVGAERFSRTLDNTDIPKTIMSIAGKSL